MLFRSLVVSAVAAVAQASYYSGWSIRADWSRCNSTQQFEVALEGNHNHIHLNSSIRFNQTRLPRRAEFSVDAPLTGASLFIRPCGSKGRGRLGPPQQHVNLDIYKKKKQPSGIWANATVVPGFEVQPIAKIVWDGEPNKCLTPSTPHISMDQRHKDGTESLTTKTGPNVLSVYFCGVPEAPKPQIKQVVHIPRVLRADMRR